MGLPGGSQREQGSGRPEQTWKAFWAVKDKQSWIEQDSKAMVTARAKAEAGLSQVLERGRRPSRVGKGAVGRGGAVDGLGAVPGAEPPADQVTKTLPHGVDLGGVGSLCGERQYVNQ